MTLQFVYTENSWVEFQVFRLLLQVLIRWQSFGFLQRVV